MTDVTLVLLLVVSILGATVANPVLAATATIIALVILLVATVKAVLKCFTK